MHAELTRCRLNKLSRVDIRTGEPIRRYEHDTPGSLIHVDVKKLGNTPDGGGRRYVDAPRRPQPRRHPWQSQEPVLQPKMGTAFVHTVIGDHSRVACAEIHEDETAATGIALLRRAMSWFAVRDVIVARVLSDDG